MSDEMGILCAVDPYCQWSYGFVPTLITFWEKHRDEMPFHVACAGLYRDAGVRPMRDIEGIAESNAKVAEVLGAEFGPAYEALLADGSFEMNSLDATRGFAALKDVAPERTLDLLYAQMQAFFRDGKSLSAPETYRDIAAAFDLDGDAIVEYFRSPVSHAAAQQDFTVIHDYGVGTFPAVALVQGLATAALALGATRLEDLERAYVYYTSPVTDLETGTPAEPSS